MIPTVHLTPQVETSRLAFGTSRLHYVDRSTGERLLAIAADCGFSHFDTAPSYGDGLAEKRLGAFLKGRRDRFILATKYGIPPDRMIAAVPALAAPVRASKALAKRAGLLRQQLPLFTSGDLRISVESSLRRLATDHIDILFLHQPRPDRFDALEDVFDELGRLRERGLIRFAGLAGDYAGIRALGANFRQGGLIVQTGEQEWPEIDPPHITYGALSSGRQSYFAAGQSGATIEHRLRTALARRPGGVVIVSSTKPRNLVDLPKVADQPTTTASERSASSGSVRA